MDDLPERLRYGDISPEGVAKQHDQILARRFGAVEQGLDLDLVITACEVGKLSAVEALVKVIDEKLRHKREREQAGKTQQVRRREAIKDAFVAEIISTLLYQYCSLKVSPSITFCELAARFLRADRAGGHDIRKGTARFLAGKYILENQGRERVK